jgi:putative ABC transport system ATP-binding protein
MFQKLNRDEGITIVIVTHERDVGEHCKRIIRMRDGRIEGEEIPTNTPGEAIKA